MLINQKILTALFAFFLNFLRDCFQFPFSMIFFQPQADHPRAEKKWRKSGDWKQSL